MISADEKTSIQARSRKHATLPPAPEEPMRVEHEYGRRGALAYLAAWEVRRAKLFGRCETATGIKPFERLVAEVMGQEPSCSASRVFWILDNGSSHRGTRGVERLQKTWPTLIPGHLPVHASWLNQIEIYFSILQRKVLTPNDFLSLTVLTSRILQFQERYEQIAEPSKWKFTKDNLADMMTKLSTTPIPLARAACLLSKYVPVLMNRTTKLRKRIPRGYKHGTRNPAPGGRSGGPVTRYLYRAVRERTSADPGGPPGA